MHLDLLLKYLAWRINYYLQKHMIYLLVKMSCTENPMMEGGIQPLYPNSYQKKVIYHPNWWMCDVQENTGISKALQT